MARNRKLSENVGATIEVTANQDNIFQYLWNETKQATREYFSPQADVVSWDQIQTGRRFDLSYEPQVGQPIDGGSEILRQFSPFSISFELPEDIKGFIEQEYGGVSPFSYIRDRDEAFSFDNVFDGLGGEAYTEAYLQQSTFQQNQSRPEASYVGRTQINNYASQLMRMATIPELFVLVNPSSMSVSYTKIQDFSSRTRKNRIFRAWGEEQPNISFSFTTGGFIAGQQRHFWGADSDSPSGLQYASKKLSAAWQNFMKIFQTYQNSALLYDTIFDTEAHLGVGGLVIKYDQMIYRGLIESFDFSYSDEDPNKLTFEISFIVSQMEDVSDDSGAVAPLFDANGGGLPI